MDILFIVALLCFSAFFSASETAFLSLGKVRFKQIENMQTGTSKRVIGLLSDPQRLLVTILIGNTLVNTAASSLMTDVFYERVGESGVCISIIFMTFIILIFGEVTPKIFALSNAQKVSFFASLPILWIERLLAPIRFILEKVTVMMVQSVGIKIKNETSKITAQELRYLFSLGKERGVVKEKEQDMVENILLLNDLNTADIMTPRINIVGLDLTEKKDDLVTVMKKNQYSRLPVYINSLDNIVGLIYTKEFLLNPTVPFRELIKSPYFVPESMRLDTLLKELQTRKIHMAVVTDEYGVTSGVVTIEDLLEEIVGEIRDELDSETPAVKKLDENTFEVKGATHINEVNESIGMCIETEEVDTIGGYITLKIERIPNPGDEVLCDGHVLRVESVEQNRVTVVKVIRVTESGLP